jgi:neutral amino acid transport system permease protein
VFQQLAQLIANGLITGSILALAAVGLTMVFGIQRIPNFAHGEYLTIGAYAAFLANVTWQQNLLVATLFAALVVAIFSVVVHFILLRPLRNRGLVAMSLITVGLGLILRNLISLIEGVDIRKFAIDQTAVYDLTVIRLSPGQVAVTVVALIACPAVALLLTRTTIGKNMRAVADNRDLASIAGINTDRIGTYVWIMAGALAGLGGVMYALVQGTFDPNLGFNALFLVFTAVVLGGIGSPFGALAGGLALGLAMEVATWQGFLGGFDFRYKPVLAFVVLIALLMYRPQGLFGKARVI